MKLGDVTAVPELVIGDNGTKFAAFSTQKRCSFQTLGLHFLIEKNEVIRQEVGVTNLTCSCISFILV